MASAPQTETGVVRGAVGYASSALLNLYSKTSNYPVVKLGVQLYQPLAPIVAPVVKRVAVAADPWVDSVDTVVTGAWKTVSVKVIDPARKKSPKGEISVFGVAAEVREVATIELKNRYSALLDYSDHAVDYWLPETEKSTVDQKEIESTKTVTNVTKKISKRALKKLTAEWQTVRAFSAGRLKEIVKVDIAAQVESGVVLSLKWSQEHVLPVVETGKVKGALVLSAAKTQYTLIHKASAEKLKLLYDAILKYRILAHEKFTLAYSYGVKVADQYGVPIFVAKTKEVSLTEVSDYVLVKLKFKKQSEEFIVAEKKLVDLFRTLLKLILFNKDIAVKVQPSTPASTPAPAPTPVAN